MKMFENRTKLAALVATPLIAFAIALIGGAFTQHASAQTPNSKKPFAVGAITTGSGTTVIEHVAFAAQQNPKTTDPMAATGHVVQELATGTNSGKVTCFQPNGNTATITFLVDKGPNAGMYRSFFVIDLGEPSMGVSPDQYYGCGATNTNCGGSCMYQPILRGNIVVSQ
jgi:hypothetical protein